MRSVIFRVSFALVGACHAVMELFRMAARFFTALAWGVARRSDLVRLIRRRWDQERVLASEPLVLRGLFSWEERFYDRHLPAGRTVGLIGCGAGRDLIGLVRRGHSVTGMDLSGEMIETARRHLAAAVIEAPLFIGDVHDMEFPGGTYDVFIFSNFTYVLISGSVRRVEILNKLQPRLSPDGKIVIFYFCNQSLRESWTIRLARLVARVTGNHDQPEAGDELSRFHDFQHHFTHAEIAHEAKRAGYGIAEVVSITDYDDGFAAILKPSTSMELEHVRQAPHTGGK